jgi:hypothetical protein
LDSAGPGDRRPHEEVQCDGRWSTQALMRLRLWVEYSASYLRYPSEPAVVMTLIAQLNCAEWGSPLCEVEEHTLYRALMNPFTEPSSP